MTHQRDDDLDRFLLDLVHDLRNLLEGLESVWFRSQGTSAPDAEIQDVVHREIYGLVRKVEGYLDRTRLSENRLTLQKTTVDLRDVCRKTAEKLGAFLRQRKLSFELGEEGATVLADRGSVERILASLIHAAYRLTAAGDPVSISLFSRSADEIALAVVLPRTSRAEAVLQGFFSNQDENGAGIWAARELARAQGGDLRWEAGNAGEERLRLELGFPARAETESPARDEPAAPRRLDILVVDDNADSAKSLAMLLSLEGHRAESCHDGRSALEASRSRRPDVVLLDLGLPDINGYEVCRALRQSSGGSRLLLIAFSGRGDDEARRLSREAGFDAHLVKPVDPAELFRVLAQTSSRREIPIREGGSSRGNPYG